MVILMKEHRYLFIGLVFLDNFHRVIQSNILLDFGYLNFQSWHNFNRTLTMDLFIRVLCVFLMLGYTSSTTVRIGYIAADETYLFSCGTAITQAIEDFTADGSLSAHTIT